MKFIFPQNYKFNSKILGLVDYQTGILNLIWGGIVFIILNIIFSSLNIKIFLFIILVLPLVIFSVVGVNGENVINVITYTLKFLMNPKLYFYSK